MLLKTILNTGINAEFTIDEDAYLADMERTCPLFFKTKFGARETYAVYKGFLIVRSTVKFSHGSERRTSVFAYSKYADSTKMDLHCVSSGNEIHSVSQAEKLIDKIIEGGKYSFGMDF